MCPQFTTNNPYNFMFINFSLFVIIVQIEKGFSYSAKGVVICLGFEWENVETYQNKSMFDWNFAMKVGGNWSCVKLFRSIFIMSMLLNAEQKTEGGYEFAFLRHYCTNAYCEFSTTLKLINKWPVLYMKQHIWK